MKRLSFIAVLLFVATTVFAQKNVDNMMEFLKKNNPELAKELDAQKQAQTPSDKAQAALKAALKNEGVITVVDNATGAVLKTLKVNPAEAALRTPGGSFHVYITNPARLAIEINNIVHSDLYQVKLPRTIPESNGNSVVVGAQFSGTRYASGKGGIVILSNRDNIFKLQISGSGTFYDENLNQTPASVAGVIEATYLGAVKGQGMTEQQSSQEQQLQEVLKMLEGLNKK
jgi:hypothetical protein